MDAVVQQLLGELREQIAELRAELKARDERLAAKDAQIAGLMDVITRVAEGKGGAASAPPMNSPTVGELFDLFRRANERAHSWRVMRQRLEPFIAALGSRRAMDITPAVWAAHRNIRKGQENKRGTLPSPLTLNFELDWAKRLLNWATEPEQGLLPSNPLARARHEKANTMRDTWLTEPDIAKLLQVSGDVLRAFILIAVDTGLRLSEILQLRRAHIRPNGAVDISRRATKARRAHRVALTDRALDAIRQLPDTINPFVFASPVLPGRPYHTRYVQQLFRNACEETGLDSRAAEGDVRIRCHDLRHSAATAVLRRGGKITQVQRMLNHSSLAVTARYLHHDEDDAVALAKLMEDGASRERAAEAQRRGPQRAQTPNIDPAAKKATPS